MSLVALSQQDEYGLAHSEQDCRGWTVIDAAGTTLGICTDMIVDTEAEHIDSIVVDSGARIAASDITLQAGTVLVGGAGALTTDALRSAEYSSSAALADSTSDVTVPVIEERIKVGKREVSSGGVRVSQRVTDQPVEETVTLRDERVYVERRPVNRPAETVAADAFTDGVLEITETDEEAVVAKQARVVEEVIVRKAVTDRQETIRDTVTRTDVAVEELSGEPVPLTERATTTDRKA